MKTTSRKISPPQRLQFATWLNKTVSENTYDFSRRSEQSPAPSSPPRRPPASGKRVRGEAPRTQQEVQSRGDGAGGPGPQNTLLLGIGIDSLFKAVRRNTL